MNRTSFAEFMSKHNPSKLPINLVEAVKATTKFKTGDTIVTRSGNGMYFEKFCISNEEMLTLCPGWFRRLGDHYGTEPFVCVVQDKTTYDTLLSTTPVERDYCTDHVRYKLIVHKGRLTKAQKERNKDIR